MTRHRTPAALRALPLIGALACVLACAPACPPLRAQIIPHPATLERRDGSFTLDARTRIVLADTGNPHLREIAEDLRDALNSAAGISPAIAAGAGDATGVRGEDGAIALGCNLLSSGDPSSYTLDITPSRVVINAPDVEGVFHAGQSLRQLVLGAVRMPRGGASIPCMHVSDAPRFRWRGMLLDCGRHFMTKEFVKRYIDLLALHHMNRLHWHLTEDQGWRIEIRRHPRLTEVGSTRIEKDGSVHAGFYTQDDIREVLEHARRRFVTVVPEIEMPGHSLAALAAYPQYSCTGGPFTVENSWGVFKDIYCAGNDSTFTFIEDVLDEVLALFPSPWIHIGGDEAPKFRWEHCGKCQARMQAEGLKTESELQSWFIRRIERWLSARGRHLIGWDEILEGGLAPGAIVQSWRGMDGAREAALTGHAAIVSPTSHAYLDYDIATTSLEKVYSFDPVPAGLPMNATGHILGGECNLWSERAPQEKVDNRVFPRLLAMAEVLWSPAAQRSWPEFHERVMRYYEVLDRLGVTYGWEAQPARFSTRVLAAEHAVEVRLTPGQAGLDLRATTDGSDPAGPSSSRDSVRVVRAPSTLRAAAVRSTGALAGKVEGEFRLRIDPHAALGAPVRLAHPYGSRYTAGGDGALTDGVRGSDDFHDGRWQGTEEDDVDAVLDLGRPQPLHTIETAFLQNAPAWIFLPTTVEFQISNSGTEWTSLRTERTTVPVTDERDIVQQYRCEARGATARYVRVIARNLGHCPATHPGAGGKAWLFTDEITVR